MTIFMISHDIQESFQLGTRLLTFDKLRHDPQSPEAYGASVTYDMPLSRAHRRATRPAANACQAVREQLAGGPCDRLASFHGSVACDSDRRSWCVAGVAVAIWMRATRQKAAPVDPIATTTGSNRTLTGTPSGGHRAASLNWDEALRRFVAYALDDAPREALSQPPDPDARAGLQGGAADSRTHRSASRIHPAPALAAAEVAGDGQRQ